MVLRYFDQLFWYVPHRNVYYRLWRVMIHYYVSILFWFLEQWCLGRMSIVRF